MIPLVLTAPEVLAALAGTLTEIRRPVDMSAIDAVCRAWITHCDVDPDDNEAIFASDREDLEHFRRGVACPFGSPGDLLYGQEVWAAHWIYNDRLAEGARSTLPGDNRWYQADGDDAPGSCGCPAKGRRGVWRSAGTMPEWASRIRLVNRGVRVERADVWTWCVAVERAGGDQ